MLLFDVSLTLFHLILPLCFVTTKTADNDNVVHHSDGYSSGCGDVDDDDFMVVIVIVAFVIVVIFTKIRKLLFSHEDYRQQTNRSSS